MDTTMETIQIADVWHWLREVLEPLPEHADNDTAKGNRTDVMCANCIGPRDKIACARAGTVAFLGAVTAAIAISRVFTLHSNRTLSPVKLLLYYLLVMHCAAMSLEWIFGWTTPITLFISYLKAIELLIVCYVYLDVAVRMMHWNPAAGKSLSLGSLMLMFTFFTAFVVLGFLMSIEPWSDCHAPYWIWFSLGQLATVQLMVMSFLMIIHRINRIAATPSVRRLQRTQLLCLLYVYETSAFVDVAWHVALYMLGDDQKGCSGIFNHDQIRYTAFKLPYDVLCSLLPVWAILYVFRPALKTRQQGRGDDELEDEEDLSGHTAYSDVVVVRNWQRRYRPLNTARSEQGYRTRGEDRAFVDPMQHVRRARAIAAKAGTVGVRRVSSAPSMIPPTRRPSVSRSLISSPLYPIPEEPFHQYSRLYDDEEDDEEFDFPGPSGAYRAAATSIDNVSTDGLVDGEH